MIKFKRKKSLWFIAFYHSAGKSFAVLLQEECKQHFVYILALKMQIIKLVGKIFVVCRKFTKVFRHVVLIVYGIYL